MIEENGILYTHSELEFATAIAQFHYSTQHKYQHRKWSFSLDGHDTTYWIMGALPQLCPINVASGGRGRIEFQEFIIIVNDILKSYHILCIGPLIVAEDRAVMVTMLDDGNGTYLPGMFDEMARLVNHYLSKE